MLLDPSGSGRISVDQKCFWKISVANVSPGTGVNRYVEGPYPFSDFVAGEYRGILAVDVPLLARDVRLDGTSQIVAAGADETTRVVAGNVRVFRGETVKYTLRFTVPKGRERLQVIPSARFPAIRYTAGSQHWDDDGPHELHW